MRPPLDPVTDDEAQAIARIRDRFPSSWRSIMLRLWDGQRPTGTAGALSADDLAVIRHLRNRRGVTWLGSYRP